MESTEISCVGPVPTGAQLPPLSTSPARVVHLLWAIGLHWRIITQSPQFTAGFTLAMHILSSDKRLMVRVYHQSITEESHCPANPLCLWLVIMTLFKKRLFIVLIIWPYLMAYGILVPPPGIKPSPLHWKARVLTTGPPGKFHNSLWFNVNLHTFDFIW